MSFNQNLKRVAGPTFVINVRYDDHHKMRTDNNINVNKLLELGRRLPEISHVKEGELLVSYKQNNGAHYMDGYTHCFSYANAFPKINGATVEAVKKEILSKVRFIGVAATEFVPSAAYQEQGFVAQVGGVVTVTNESHSTIYPGDKVMLDVALRGNAGSRAFHQKGIPAEKIRFTVRRADTVQEMAKEAAAEAGDDPAKIIKAYQEKQELIIGKAFKYAKHGDRLEINLQPRCSY